MGVALKHLSHVISEVAPGAPLVFCGDFNSTPSAGNSRKVPTAESEMVYKNIMTLRSKFIFTMSGVFFNTVFIQVGLFLDLVPSQVCFSCSVRLWFLRSMQTGAARGRRSPAAWSCSLTSPLCWAPADCRPTPTMWEGFKAAWITSSYSRTACRYWWQRM